MKNVAYKTLKLIRPKQWIKNLALFAPIVFSGELFNPHAFTNVFYGFFIFCGLSSAIYIFNDINDIQKDKQHPFKRFRPLAHGDLSIPFAICLFFILLIFSLFWGLFITQAFFVSIVIYVLLQFSYSLFIKNIAILDILAVASGYMLRVYAGEFASSYHISVWLLLTTIALSLFLAVGKRKSELTLLVGTAKSNVQSTRQALSHYSDRLLDVYASLFATSTFIFYSLFTFLENPNGGKITNGFLLPDFLPSFFQRKWLMLTIIPVVYGLMRYLQDIYEKHEGESPEKVLLSDRPLLIAVTSWVILVIGIIYYVLGPT